MLTIVVVKHFEAGAKQAGRNHGPNKKYSMKTRTWLCYALDILGSFALLCAGFALLAALWFAASVPEPILLIAFKYCLITSVGAFLTARVCELTELVRRNEVPGLRESAPPATDNVEQLPAPKHLPRAA